MNNHTTNQSDPQSITRNPTPDTRYPTSPRLSILIPNYNNGRESAKDGQIDLMGDLLQSLHETLADDPTPLEIIVHDDGSTDDSLHTLRQWSQKTWRGGQPFLKLIEAPHCGILAVTANKLVAASQGEILVRLDGDIVVLTPNWAQKLCAIFDAAPARLGVIGPKQLGMTGAIHAFGDWLLHPKGYHHIAMGLPRESVTEPIECDHVMGCFYCCKREVHDRIGGYDESILRGQTIDFGLRARQAGYFCIAVPQIEFIHRHGTRKSRATRADTPEGVAYTLDVFEKKWGFNRLAPDLDFVREKFRGSDLLWNPRIFAPGSDPALGSISSDGALSRPGVGRFTGRPIEPLTIQNSEWSRYTADPNFKAFVDFQVAVTNQVVSQITRPRRVLLIDGNCGLLAHLLARLGLNVTAVNTDPRKIALAQQCVKNQTYPASADKPQFMLQQNPRRLPFDDRQFDLLLAYHVLERHPNPVGLLKELRRVSTDSAMLTVITPRRRADRVQDDRYLPHELAGQIHAVGGWQMCNDPNGTNAQQPLIAIARRQVIAATSSPDRAEAA
ncbi:MAG: methyltransferase domain-containing protein [Phycisphaeraceae bacterium]|nr:methyltransferase domain-containing protein [Phycisphaeraceae bacterium]